MTAFAPLFATEALAAAVSGRAWLEAMLEAERALATAGARAGVVPDEAAAAIAAACVVDEYSWERLLEEGRPAGTPVEPLVRLLAERAGEAGRWVHHGATSQDIMDTAAMLISRQALGLVDGELTRVAAACAALAREHRETPMAGRTLLQHAVPTTFGLKAAGWLVSVLDARARLAELRASGLAAQLGGAAGTLAALGERALDVSSHYARELGLAEATLPWHANRVRIAELGSTLLVAAGVVEKLALDLQLLAQTEVGEVREGGAAGGSSTMPHKRNPVGATWARAAARLARAHAGVLLEAPIGEHERAAGAWQAEWEGLSGALATSGAAAAALAGALETLEVDTERMRANLDLTRGAVASERLAHTLAERLGRSEARALVREASLTAAASGRALADELGRTATGLSALEIETALDATTYLGAAPALVDRALERYAAEQEERT